MKRQNKEDNILYTIRRKNPGLQRIHYAHKINSVRMITLCGNDNAYKFEEVKFTDYENDELCQKCLRRYVRITSKRYKIHDRLPTNTEIINQQDGSEWKIAAIKRWGYMPKFLIYRENIDGWDERELYLYEINNLYELKKK